MQEYAHTCAYFACRLVEYDDPMIRDVTELLRVDTDRADADSVDRAVALIEQGMEAVVVDDRYAVDVLVRLGATDDRARDQVQASHGPMRSDR